MSVGTEDRQPRVSTGTGAPREPGVMAAPGNGQAGVRPSHPKKGTESTAQGKCIYTSVPSVGDTQEELEAIRQLENGDRITLMGSCWDQLPDWGLCWVAANSSGGTGREAGGAAPSVREGFSSLELHDGDDRGECV